jgi:uncharacterized membrane protein
MTWRERMVLLRSGSDGAACAGRRSSECPTACHDGSKRAFATGGRHEAASGIGVEGRSMTHFREWIEFVSLGIEGVAVTIMVCIILVGTTRWLFNSANGIEGAYERYREMLGKTLQVGLELLVAADIIHTVAIDLTLVNIGLLAALVVVRTVIGWTLTVELEGQWPWQGGKKSRPRPEGTIHG